VWNLNEKDFKTLSPLVALRSHDRRPITSRGSYGARVDIGYVRASDVLNSRNHSDVLSYLAGPVFYPVRRRNLTVFAQGLFGAARVTGAVPLSGGGFLTGYANQFALAVGTGAEYRVYEPSVPTFLRQF
jgi:hypothetical protein